MKLKSLEFDVSDINSANVHNISHLFFSYSILTILLRKNLLQGFMAVLIILHEIIKLQSMNDQTP